MKRFIIYTSLALSLASFTVFAQEKSNTSADSKNADKNNGLFVFEATNMYPMKGRGRVLDPGYTLTFSRDTLYAHLPYVGQATFVAYGTNDGGINLATADFNYKETASKKSRKVEYKMNSAQDVTSVIVEIYDNGTANLNFIFAQRQPISFRGNVSRKEP